MLDKIDLEAKLSSKEYSLTLESLEPRLGFLQRNLKERSIPVVILFEGWEASGKGTAINNLIMPLDPRGFKVFPMAGTGENDRFHPYLWPFWNRLPSGGQITIFDRSWYKVLLDEEKAINERVFLSYLKTFNSLERLLTDSGTVIIKFFLHIERKEQKRRLEKLNSDPSTSWRVKKRDFRQNKNYESVKSLVERALQASDTDIAPWYIIPSTDERLAAVQIMNTVVNCLENALERRDSATGTVNPWSGNTSVIDSLNLSRSIEKDLYDKRLAEAQKKLREYQHLLYKKRKALVVVYEGMDAAGKGGNIRRLTAKLDPRGYEVIPIGAPNDTEKSYHYLWRFWTNMPKDGHIAIFDRSWYGRVMVERVEGFASEAEWARAYREINDMEEQLHDHGTVVAKFWLHIDLDEQLKRFQARENDPEKQWKITPDDWRNREKWELYKPAIEEMLVRTSTSYAPWTVVESNDKRYARVKVLETLVKLLEENL
jgi:polyphosphate:AMP phosphotransferase